MFFYSNVPLVNKDVCPKASDHNRLARQFNRRLAGPGPACAWNIFFYADSIFLGVRNTATPGVPLGVNPPEDEWWKVYYNIEFPTVNATEGNWPMAKAGTPQGANVMNPLNAFIFGRVTYENKLFYPMMGPWAEGNLFDGLVESSRAVHANSVFWSNSFRQRGAFKPNSRYSSSNYKKHRGGKARYLPSRHDAVHFSKGLFWVGRSTDHFFPEYASQHVYMRYPPAIYGGSYRDKYTNTTVTPPQGILKRKNATKDILQWALWVYTFYFKGNEQQRSLFCEKKSWDAPIIDFIKEASFPYLGEQVYGERGVRTNGPLNVCKVGFDFFSYYTRQNILAPVFGAKVYKQKAGGDPSVDGMGYAKIDQYRPVLKFTIGSGESEDNWRGEINGVTKNIERRKFSGSGPYLENYDEITDTTSDYIPSNSGGKCLRFSGDHDKLGEPAKPNEKMLLKFSYDQLASKNTETELNLSALTSSRSARPCLAGYFLKTDALDNENFQFILRIWRGSSIIHETLIYKKYSYSVNKNAARATPASGEVGYVFNKIFYFKNPVYSGKIRFEIVPFKEDKVVGLGKYKKMATQGLSGQEIEAGLVENAYDTYKERRLSDANTDEGDEKKGYDRIISFGNPYSTTISTDTGSEKTFSSGSGATEYSVVKPDNRPSYMMVPTTFDLNDGDMVKIYKSDASGDVQKRYAGSGTIYFVGEDTSCTDNSGNRRAIFFGNRRDSRCDVVSKDWEPAPKRWSAADRFLDIHDFVGDDSPDIKLTKMTSSEDLFKVILEPAILLRQRPSFQDAYSLLRVTTAKKEQSSNSLLAMLGYDDKGVDGSGHGFYESNKIFKNYIKYGSGANINGGEIVKALKQFVNYNPVYESARKFISSYLRMADRTHLINYTIEGGKGVLYLKRFNPNMPKKAKSTVLDNMEPGLDPCGRFYDAMTISIENLPSTRYKPILSGVQYYMHIPTGESSDKLKYNGTAYGHGQTFTGSSKASFLENDTLNVDTCAAEIGAYEVDSIKTAAPIGGESNEWVMFLNGVHYSNGGIYRPEIYGDVMGFLNNRCHHRSHEYERTSGPKYDMIREELMRSPTLSNRSRFEEGSRLQVFLSKSSNNFNYIFNTNNPNDGDLETYGVTDYVSRYRKACPPVNPRPYKVTSCKVVNYEKKSLTQSKINPSYKKNTSSTRHRSQSDVVRVQLDRPLSRTGRLHIGSGGWVNIDANSLLEEPYRTDENTIMEYLFSQNVGGYACKRMMLGDYGATTWVHKGYGYRPQGACFPRFYFLKLIPTVGKDSILDVSPYAQMDFYLRAMCGEFIMPYNYYNAPGQVDSVNWKYTELASRSAEEDPTAYYYVDPREISSS